MTAALHAALRQAFTAAELAQLHNEADRELNAATDYDLWSRLVDTLFYASQDEGDNPQSIPGQPDGIEDGSRDMPDPAKAGERILAYVSNMGDGLYHAAAGQPLYGRDLESVVRAFQRLTDSEDSRVVLLEAENKRLRDELGSARDWEAWERMQKRIAELEAAAERAKPVLDAAREWRRWFPHADSMFAPENALIAAVDAHRLGECVDETAVDVEEDLRSERKLPVCADCGHRHRWGGECADHSWTDACPYEADANCEAGRPETVAEKPTGGISEMTMAAIAAYARATGMIPSDATAEEAVCPRCGGRDGMHLVRKCELWAQYPHAKCADWMLHQPHVWGDPKHWCTGEAAEGLSSTDTTAVERG